MSGKIFTRHAAQSNPSLSSVTGSFTSCVPAGQIASIKKLLSSFWESAVIWNFFQFSVFSVVFLGIFDSDSTKNNEKRLKLETL